MGVTSLLNISNTMPEPLHSMHTTSTYITVFQPDSRPQQKYTRFGWKMLQIQKKLKKADGKGKVNLYSILHVHDF